MLNKLKQWLKSDKKENRGILAISLEPNSLEAFIEDKIKEAIVMYMKGFHDIRRDKGIGAEHIKLHLEQGSEGEITLKELLNLGNSIRAYLKEFKEPFVETSGRKLYEWQDEAGVRFRVVVDKPRNNVVGKEGLDVPLSLSNDIIITFYSDRNLNERMEFKNPKVKEYYENLEHKKNNKGQYFFTLCKQLAKLLGENDKAVADVVKLYERHKDMFGNEKEVRDVIEKVVSSPEIIVDATRLENEKNIFKAAKKLDNEKMGDVVIKNKNGTNIIFHANKKNIKEFDRLQKQIQAGGRFAHFLHPDLLLSKNNSSAWAGLDKHSPANPTIPNPTLKNTESPNIQSFLGIDYGNINKHTQDKFAHIEQKTNENLAQVSSLDNLAMSKLIEQSEKESKEKETNKINIERKKR